MALEIGIGMGAMLAGQIYNGDPDNFPVVFAGCGSLAFLAFVYILFKGK